MWWCDEGPIPILNPNLVNGSISTYSLKDILYKALNEKQLLILKNVKYYNGKSLTSVLKELSKRYNVPLSTLKHNARLLRQFNLLRLDDGAKRVSLTPLGEFVTELMEFNVVNEEFSVRFEVIKDLEEKARLVRKYVLNMIAEAGSGHVGASLSIVDILVTLYFAKMRYDPRNPKWSLRDRLILSKGHAAPALYAVLALAGFIPVTELSRFRDIGSYLSGHPEVDIPGVDMVSGSLGQGLSVGCGMAIALKRDGIKSKVYVVLGDGELDEGQVWEAALTASKYRLDNLVVIIDRNGYQQEGETEVIKPLEPLSIKWLSFGWYVVEIYGHNFRDIINALYVVDRVKDKPSVIIAHTIKGKGYPPAEGNNNYHSKPVSKDEIKMWC